MPRKDRTFKAEDLLRIYCRHLTDSQMAVLEAFGLDFSCPAVEDPLTDDEIIIRILEALTSPPLANIIELAPYGDRILIVLGWALEVYKLKTMVGDDFDAGIAFEEQLATLQQLLGVEVDGLPST
jgi:hypothetical protein